MSRRLARRGHDQRHSPPSLMAAAPDMTVMCITFSMPLGDPQVSALTIMPQNQSLKRQHVKEHVRGGNRSNMK